MARFWIVFLVASSALPRWAAAERRALVLVRGGDAVEAEELGALAERLEAAGFSLASLPAPDRPRGSEAGTTRVMELAREGLVLLARGRLEEADAALAAALAEVPASPPAEVRAEAFGACLDRARIARIEGDRPGAEGRVAECRRSFPLEDSDARRTPPEIRALLDAVDARREVVALEPGDEGCRARGVRREEPLAELAVLPGAVVELTVTCASGLEFSRRLRIDGGERVIYLSPSLEERIVVGGEGALPRLYSDDPGAHARALSEVRGAEVFVLGREGRARVLIRADEAGVFTARGESVAEAAERALGPERAAKRARRSRAAAWGTSAAGLAFYATALTFTGRRVSSMNRVAALAPHDPRFLEEREKFDAARVHVRWAAALGALGLGAAGALARPIPRRWAFASAGIGVGLLVAGAGLFASAPVCDASQARFSSCLAREVRRDAALVVASASTPLFALSSRSFLARARSLSLGLGAGGVRVSYRFGGPPGPRARDGVSFHRKE